MLVRDVAPGIHRLEHADTNLYIVEHNDRILVVDAGLPSFWPRLLIALAQLGYDRSSVDGILLTHAHFDHVGFARRARQEWDVPVWVHPDDAFIAAHPYRYLHEKARWQYPFRHPGGLGPLWKMTKAGALFVAGITDPTILSADTDLPGNPVIIPTPGHTFGHVAVHFPDRDALLVGDAIVTLDPYTGEVGPQIVAGAATADSGLALSSLDALLATDAGTVLPGHGAEWTGGIASAVTLARRRGSH